MVNNQDIFNQAPPLGSATVYHLLYPNIHTAMRLLCPVELSGAEEVVVGGEEGGGGSGGTASIGAFGCCLNHS